MIEGKTSTGFCFQLPDNAQDNWELWETISELETEPTAVFRVLKILLPADQRARLMDHCRTEDRRVPLKAVSQELGDIINALPTGKN